jgi:tetratricopeptide (TPR) repeat protein
MKLRPIPKIASNYQIDKDIYMKTKILLCAGLLTIGTIITLDSTWVMAKGSPQRERSSQKNAIATEKNAEYYYQSGNAKLDRRDYQGAFADYNKSLKINPNYSNAYNNRGVARNKLFDHYGAIDDFNRALEINPNNSAALENLEGLREGLRRDRQRRALDQMNRVRNSGGGSR